jgi:PadR family transcriptional regulator, regulatory protein PadR
LSKAPVPNLLQGTLDLLVLHALQRGALHGYAIAQTIHLLSDEVLKVEEGSLYPALYRLELEGAISSEWGLSENNRRAKYYSITRKGRKALDEQQQTWTRLSGAVQRVLSREA